MSRIVAVAGGSQRTIDLEQGQVLLDGTPLPASLRLLPSGLHELTIANDIYEVFCARQSETQFDIWIKHFVITVTLEDLRSQMLRLARVSSLDGEHTTIVIAPMPGLVRAIEVSVGEIVEPGKGLVVLEAMKMENEIRATVRGRVREIKVKDRMVVEKNQQLLLIEPII